MSVTMEGTQPAAVEGSGKTTTSLQTQLKRLGRKSFEAAEGPNSINATREIEQATLQVPVIDLAGLASGDALAREKIVREITEACKTWGIFQIVNHGVPERIFEVLETEARKFFSLPLEVKERANEGINKLQCGFIRSMQTKYSSHVSWREVLAGFGPTSETVAMMARIWAGGNPTFYNALEDNFKEVEHLWRSLMEILAQGLGLQPYFFSQHFGGVSGRNRFYWRFNLYAPCENSDPILALGPHRDPNLLTLLKQGPVCGLQAKRGDEWVAVTPTPGALIVNAGDCLEAWSNGIFTSVLHRVVLTETTDRLSTVILVTPESVLVQAPPELIDDEHPALYKPFTFDDLFANLCAKFAAVQDPKDFDETLSTQIFNDFALIRGKDPTNSP